jgi:hypothetical protein
MCSFCDDRQYDRELAHSAARRQEDEEARQETLAVLDEEIARLKDGLGQDVLQGLLAAAYAQYMLNSTRNLIGHIYGGSPLIQHKREQAAKEFLALTDGGTDAGKRNEAA